VSTVPPPPIVVDDFDFVDGIAATLQYAAYESKRLDREHADRVRALLAEDSATRTAAYDERWGRPGSRERRFVDEIIATRETATLTARDREIQLALRTLDRSDNVADPPARAPVARRLPRARARARRRTSRRRARSRDGDDEGPSRTTRRPL
jgi:hypothetical protein